MYVNERCAACLFDKQKRMTDDPGYLEEVADILDNRKETDTAPYMTYLFDRAYERRFGKSDRYGEIKKKYNDLALSMEGKVRELIRSSSDPLQTAVVYARTGNYIDFGAQDQVDPDTFLRLFEEAKMSAADLKTYASFREQCAGAERLLLIADNCGEIVFDKLLAEQLKEAFPAMDVTVMVRGSEVLNDATEEDARYVGLNGVCSVVANGTAAAGTIWELLPEEARKVLCAADVILSKGQGNYESLSRQGRHAFYLFLCKCDLFTERYDVPKLTGMFVEEW